MKTSALSAISLTFAAAVFSLHLARAGAAEETSSEPLNVLAEKAISTDTAESASAIAQLRAAGPAGLDAMFDSYGSRVKPAQKRFSQAGPDWERIRAALDAVGQQRNCYASHLYWYTNLDHARAAARASGKPILSLRLLGKLSEEFSCANSRFFRTTLYPNAEVSR